MEAHMIFKQQSSKEFYKYAQQIIIINEPLHRFRGVTFGYSPHHHSTSVVHIYPKIMSLRIPIIQVTEEVYVRLKWLRQDRVRLCKQKSYVVLNAILSMRRALSKLYDAQLYTTHRKLCETSDSYVVIKSKNKYAICSIIFLMQDENSYVSLHFLYEFVIDKQL